MVDTIGDMAKESELKDTKINFLLEKTGFPKKIRKQIKQVYLI